MASATDQLRAQLDQAGLGDLADLVWDHYRQGKEFDWIYEQIVQSETYQDRFKGLVKLRDQDLSAGMSEGQYLQMEQAMIQKMTEKGFGASGFANQSYIGDVIGNNVSVDEFTARIQMAEAAASTMPANVRAELQERYGVGPTTVVEYYMDTERTQSRMLREQQAASLAAQYERFQTMDVGTGTFEDVARQVTADPGAAINAQEQLAGLGTLGGGLTEQQRLEGAFALNDRINRERRSRTAAFGGGGQGASTEEGVSGLGTASFS